MEVVFTHCAGLDVHKKFIVACVLVSSSQASAQRIIKTFDATLAGLEALAQWLSGFSVTHVAMESTGVYPGLTGQDRLEAGLQRAFTPLRCLDRQCP